MMDIDEALRGLITDEVPPEDQDKDPRELRATHIADAIMKSILGNRDLAHAVRDVRYNERNGAILIVLYPQATEYLSEVIHRTMDVLGVRKVMDSVLTDDESGEDFHVLKVLITDEDEEENTEAGSGMIKGQGGAPQVRLVQSCKSLINQKAGSERTPGTL